MEKKVRAHAVIAGRVQGVFFRLETHRAAERYGVFGWVRNKRDGNVEAVFEGDEKDVLLVLEWCKQGPPISKVTNLAVEWEDYIGEFSGFEITY
jgi:acylphosphatase